MSILKMIFYQPLYNGLILIYNFIPGHDLGISIILLTLLIRFVLYPLNNLSIRSQKALQDIQPKIKQVQKEFANNKEQQAKELLKLYKEHKVNPFSSCLPLLIQLPFLIALFSVFKTGITDTAFADLFFCRPAGNNQLHFFRIFRYCQSQPHSGHCGGRLAILANSHADALQSAASEIRRKR